MKLAIGLAINLAILAGFCNPAHALLSGEKLEKAKAQTVLISVERFGSFGRGTGILLDSKHVLTCAHLFKSGREDILIYTYPLGKIVRAKVEGASVADDIAILVLESSVTIKAPVFQEKYKTGDPVTVIGSALGASQWFVSQGVVSGETEGFLMTDALINPGNSGGPWFNDKGEVVAMTSWRVGPVDGIPGASGGVSARAINGVLDMRKAMNQFMEMLMGAVKKADKKKAKGK